MLALTGKPISGEEGGRIGLVDRVVDPGAASTRRWRWPRPSPRNAPLALAASKRSWSTGSPSPTPSSGNGRQQFFDEVFGSKDAIEGATAFAEKRRPNWQGE